MTKIQAGFADFKRALKPFAMCSLTVTLILMAVVTFFHKSCQDFNYFHSGNIVIEHSAVKIESILTEKDAFVNFLMPVTLNFIKKNSNGQYLMFYPILGAENFSVWRSPSESKSIGGKIHRDLRKLGYDPNDIPEKSLYLKFNLECWAFRVYYTYILSEFSPEKTVLTITSEYVANYSFVKTFSKILSFIIEGQHDHTLEIAKMYIEYKSDESAKSKPPTSSQETGSHLKEGEFEIFVAKDVL